MYSNASAGFVRVAEETRRGAHADQRVVFLVLMGIDRVVADDPEDRPDIKQGRRPARGCRNGRPSPSRHPQEKAKPRKSCGQSV